MRLIKRCGEVFSKMTLIMVSIVIFPLVTHATRPFITDDAGTIGKAGYQLETGMEWSTKKDREDGVTTRETQRKLSTIFTYGITDNLDIMAGMPYLWKKRKEGGETMLNKDRLSDMTIEVKWRFYEKDGLGLTVKPGISLPTGDYRQGFGTGRVTYGAIFIISKEIEPLGFQLNTGYTRNENKIDERKDLFSASCAITYEVIKNLTIGWDMVIASNANPKASTAPASFLFGGNYKIGKYTTIDAGIKKGLNRHEIDHAFIGGFTIKF
ncbi:MAG TPA: transporter [Syntrophorhabdaceae bacterium]|nr:transporter [Syntrophorhabdaceae bacterium]